MSSIKDINIDGRRIGTITAQRVSAASRLRQWDLRQDRMTVPRGDQDYPPSDLDRAMQSPENRYFGTAAPPTNIPAPDFRDPIARPQGERYGIEKEGDTGI